MKSSVSFWKDRKKKIILFGASKGGKRAYRCRDRAHHVLAFADNDPTKHGKTLFGKPIIKPDEIGCFPYDQIVIACNSSFQVYLQLSNLGVDTEKIRTVEQDVLLGAFELSIGQSVLLGLSIYGLGHLTYDLLVTLMRILGL